MARSSYIYVVQRTKSAGMSDWVVCDPPVVAAFTVKHELESWIEKHGGEFRAGYLGRPVKQFVITTVRARDCR